MDILNNISSIMREKKISQKELCDAIGINKQAFTNWKNGTHSSYQKYLPQIAEVLGVSVDTLLGREETTAQKEQSLSKEELEYLRLIEILTDDERQKLIDYAELLKRGRNQ